MTRTQWASALVAWCLSLGAYGYFYLGATSSNLAFLLGAVAVQLVGAWVAFHIAFGRRAGLAKAVAALLAIAIVFPGAVIYRHRHKIQNERLALREMESILGLRSGTSEEADPTLTSSSDGADGSQHTASGDEGKLVRLLRSLATTRATEMDRLRSEYEKTGMFSLLDPNRIANDQNLTDSFRIIREAKDVVQRQKTRDVNALDNYRKDIVSLDISDSQKRAALLGFDASREESLADIEMFWGLELRVLTEYEALFHLLDSRQGHWAIEDGQIVFADDADMRAFHGHISEAQKAVVQQEAVQLDVNQRQKAKLRAAAQ